MKKLLVLLLVSTAALAGEDCIKGVVGYQWFVHAGPPDSHPAKSKAYNDPTLAAILDIEIDGTATQEWRDWLKQVSATRKAEVIIEIDGEHREMTFAEFKERVLEPVRDAVCKDKQSGVLYPCTLSNPVNIHDGAIFTNPNAQAPMTCEGTPGLLACHSGTGSGVFGTNPNAPMTCTTTEPMSCSELPMLRISPR